MIERQVSPLPVSVYYSYAPEDQELLQELEKHLSLLRRERIIEDWQRGRVAPGSRAQEEMLEHLRAASLIFLLISADFMASEVCYEQELPLALKLQAEGRARVVPIYLRPVDWRLAPFASLAGLPANRKAVTDDDWSGQDAAFEQIVQGICEVITGLCGPLQVLTQGLGGRRNPLLKQQKSINRSNFLSRVYNAWIAGALESSLKRELALALDLEMMPSALAQPWPHLVFSVQAPPLQRDLLETYEHAGGDLLILGEPGAGKTTLLLQLARVLVERAEKDVEQAMPAVFPLSSWANNPRQPLSIWLVNELYERYQVPRKLAQSWLNNNLLLPLLDGLDEVSEEQRSACIKAINQYRREYYGTSIVVCSRRREYFAQDERIELQRAVLVQPLNEQQMDAYVARAGERFAPLRRLLQQDKMFRELIACPLLLNISMIAYEQNNFSEARSEQSQKVSYQDLIKSYVEQMINRRGVGIQYELKQIDSWLSNLAVQMKLHNQTTFYIEQLNMSWLMEERSQQIYRISSITISILLGALVGIPCFGLIGWLSGAQISSAVLGGVIGLVSFSLISISMSLFNPSMPFIDAFIWSWRVFRQELFIIIIGILVGAFMGGLDTKFPLVGALSGGLFGGIFGVLVGVLNSGLAETMPAVIQTMRPNQEIWRSARYSLLVLMVSSMFWYIIHLYKESIRFGVGERIWFCWCDGIGWVGEY